VQSDPGPEAKANAEFALLKLRLSTNAVLPAIEALVQFYPETENARSETGLPLRTVAFATALRLSSDLGLTETLFAGLQPQLDVCPSALTPYFVAEIARRAASAPPPIRAAVTAREQHWRTDERRRALVYELRRRVSFDSTMQLTNIWMEALGQRWLAVVQPADLRGGELTGTNSPALSIRFLHQSAVAQAFRDALQRAQKTIPAYLAIGAELEGEKLIGPALTGAKAEGAAQLLASAEGLLSQPGKELLSPPGAPMEFGRSFETLPSRPRLRLTVYLADQAALYASHRQRTAWLSGLIVAVAAAAGIGLVRARRAYWRERQLGEMKGNFVSSVSHELRAPIASIRLMAESLERGKVEEPTRQREYFRFMVQECRRLSSLIGNVLDFSRIEQGQEAV
jgi:signal transduction histidine kinase